MESDMRFGKPRVGGKPLDGNEVEDRRESVNLNREDRPIDLVVKPL